MNMRFRRFVMVVPVQLGLTGCRSVDVDMNSLVASQHRTLCQAREWVQTQTGLRQRDTLQPRFSNLVHHPVWPHKDHVREDTVQTLSFSCI